MLDPEVATRLTLLAIATTVLQARQARRWSQRRLAREAGVSQSIVAKLERVAMPDMPIATGVLVLAALDIPFTLHLMAPIAHRLTRDAAHARCIGYVLTRIQRAGFVVASEVEVTGPGWTGSIDILAFHPGAHILLVIEIKTEFHDLGELDRQVGRYERASWDAARRLGWRPRAVTALLLVLWTHQNDRQIASARAWFDGRFALRSRDVSRLLDDPEHAPQRGRRALAMIDPRTRRTRWLIPTPLDGRHTEAPYDDRVAYLDGRRRTSPSRRATARGS